MRQGGLKPKNHNSGVYWTRAHSSKSKNSSDEEIGFFSYLLFWGVLFPIVSVYTWIVEQLRRISDRG